MTKEPFISVIIPVYNCEAYFAEAVESVLAQTYKTGEIIVVDDGSTDKSAEIAGSFGAKIKYYLREHAGPAAARNYGIKLAKGDLLAFLDADDIWADDKLALQAGALRDGDNTDMVFSHVRQFYSPELNIPEAARKALESEPMPGYYLGTMLVKSVAFFRVGMFSEKWRTGEFIDWYSRAKEAGLKEVILPDVLTKRRVHKSNMGIRERSAQSDYASMLKDALDRRRRKK